MSYSKGEENIISQMQKENCSKREILERNCVNLSKMKIKKEREKLSFYL